MLQCFSGLNIAGILFPKVSSSSFSSYCAQMTCRLVEHYVPTRKNPLIWNLVFRIPKI